MPDPDQLTVSTSDLAEVVEHLLGPFAQLAPVHERHVGLRSTPSGIEWAAWTEAGMATRVAGTGTLVAERRIASITAQFVLTAAQRMGVAEASLTVDDGGLTACIGGLTQRFDPEEGATPRVPDPPTPDEAIAHVTVDRVALEAAVVGIASFGSTTHDARLVLLEIGDGAVSVSGSFRDAHPSACVPCVDVGGPDRIVCDAAVLRAVLACATSDELVLRTSVDGPLLLSDDAGGVRAVVRREVPALHGVQETIEEAGNDTWLDTTDGGGTVVVLEWDDDAEIVVDVEVDDPFGSDAVARWGRTLLSGVDLDLELATELNDLNRAARACTLVWSDGDVRAETACRVDQLTPQEFEHRCAELAELTARIAPMLQIVHG